MARVTRAVSGIGGDHTQHVLWRLENGEFDGLKPTAVVVLLIGTNNSNTDTPESIAAAIKLIIQDIQTKSPATKVLLLAIFPRNKNRRPTHTDAVTIQRVNELIARFDNARSIRFLDISPEIPRPGWQRFPPPSCPISCIPMNKVTRPLGQRHGGHARGHVEVIAGGGQ